ncbi:MAG: cytochrome c [Actinomycetota bacterium]
MANGSGRCALVRCCGALRWRAVLVVVAVVIAGCTGGEVPAAPADDEVLVLGAELYANNCRACHGPAGGGGVGTALNEGLVVERYPDIADQIALVRNGVRAMPAFGEKLSDDELEAVVRYTREVLSGG